jgi:hypothetical protein
MSLAARHDAPDYIRVSITENVYFVRGAGSASLAC